MQIAIRRNGLHFNRLGQREEKTHAVSEAGPCSSACFADVPSAAQHEREARNREPAAACPCEKQRSPHTQRLRRSRLKAGTSFERSSSAAHLFALHIAEKRPNGSKVRRKSHAQFEIRNNAAPSPLLLRLDVSQHAGGGAWQDLHANPKYLFIFLG